MSFHLDQDPELNKGSFDIAIKTVQQNPVESRSCHIVGILIKCSIMFKCSMVKLLKVQQWNSEIKYS